LPVRAAVFLVGKLTAGITTAQDSNGRGDGWPSFGRSSSRGSMGLLSG